MGDEGEVWARWSPSSIDILYLLSVQWLVILVCNDRVEALLRCYNSIAVFAVVVLLFGENLLFQHAYSFGARRRAINFSEKTAHGQSRPYLRCNVGFPVGDIVCLRKKHDDCFERRKSGVEGLTF